MAIQHYFIVSCYQEVAVLCQGCHDVQWICSQALKCCYRDANNNIQKIGRIQTKNRQVFKVTCNFNVTKLVRNREVTKSECQNGQKRLQK